MERFDNLIGGELLSVDILSPASIQVVLTVQDKNRDFDWVNLTILAESIVDAKLVEDSALKAIDMQNGVNIVFESNSFKIGFGSSEYLSSALHIDAQSIRYEESTFAI